MIVFLRNIPAQTRQSDIVNFVTPAMKPGLFGKKGFIENITVLHLKDSRTNISEFHGLVTILPDATAVRVIKRLNRKKFLNKYIAVREYHLRDWHNDPRINHAQDSLKKSEMRIGDRRRRSLDVVKQNSGYLEE